MMPTTKEVKQMFPLMDGRYVPAFRAGPVRLLVVVQPTKLVAVFSRLFVAPGPWYFELHILRIPGSSDLASMMFTDKRDGFVYLAVPGVSERSQRMKEFFVSLFPALLSIQ